MSQCGMLWGYPMFAIGIVHRERELTFIAMRINRSLSRSLLVCVSLSPSKINMLQLSHKFEQKNKCVFVCDCKTFSIILNADKCVSVVAYTRTRSRDHYLRILAKL